jgi:hypothetical protein
MVEINSGARLSLEDGTVWRIAPRDDFSVSKRWEAGTLIQVVEKARSFGGMAFLGRQPDN